MSGDEKKTQKTTTDITFENTTCNVPRNVRTQEIDQEVSSCEFVQDCILDMFEDGDEFVTLTIAEIKYGIRFVQACRGGDGIIVELGIEKENRTNLVEKICTEEECLEIFREFYDTTYVRDVEGYSPVSFFT